MHHLLPIKMLMHDSSNQNNKIEAPKWNVSKIHLMVHKWREDRRGGGRSGKERRGDEGR